MFKPKIKINAYFTLIAATSILSGKVTVFLLILFQR